MTDRDYRDEFYSNNQAYHALGNRLLQNFILGLDLFTSDDATLCHELVKEMIYSHKIRFTYDYTDPLTSEIKVGHLLISSQDYNVPFEKRKFKLCLIRDFEKELTPEEKQYCLETNKKTIVPPSSMFPHNPKAKGKK
jgi:hypothetical protein